MAILSAKKAFSEALKRFPNANMNKLHKETYKLIQGQSQQHYEKRVDDFLKQFEFPISSKVILKRKMLEPVMAGGVLYANFMEEASRRLSQSKQTTSGYIAEWCVQRELQRSGLKKDEHFRVRKEETDIIVFYPCITSEEKRHRIEIKNVKMRERGIRGLVYDGDSIIGFFDEVGEFGSGMVNHVNKYCSEHNGYAYVSPLIYDFLMKNKQLTGNTRFKLNTEIGKDMANFCKTGKL
jgi:hypothetical protein